MYDVPPYTSLYRDSGAVHLYESDAAGEWQRVAQFDIQDWSQWGGYGKEDHFGSSVGIDGNLAVIGAPDWNKLAGLTSLKDVGAIYVVEKRAEGWAPLQRIENPGDYDPYQPLYWGQNDHLGSSVAICGNTVVAGAPYDEPPPSWSGDDGSVRVYERVGETFSQTARLWASDNADGDHFGTSVAIDADTIVVGSPDDDDDGSNSGSAHVFERSGDQWQEVAKLTAADAAAGDSFGYSVAVAGDRVVVGAMLDDNDNGVDAGAVYVFEKIEGVWQQTAKLTAAGGAAGDRFGNSVSVSGNAFVVGAYRADGNRGSAYVFEKAGEDWRQDARLLAEDCEAADDFGASVALNLDQPVVGSPGDAGQRGSVYTFARQGTFAGAINAAIAPDAEGRHLYLARPGNDALVVLNRDPASGDVTLAQELVDGVNLDGVDGVEIPRDGARVYAATEAGIAVLSRDPSTGTVTWLEQIDTAEVGRPLDLEISQDGQFLFVAGSSGKIGVYRWSGTGHARSDLLDVASATALALSPDGANLYVARKTENAVSVLSWDAEEGRLDPLDEVRNGFRGVRGLQGVASLAVTNEYVLVVSEDDDSLVAFSRGAEGRLTYAQRLRNASGGVEGLENPNAVIVSPDGKWLYVTSTGDGSDRPGGVAWFGVEEASPPPARPLIIGYSGIAELTVRTGDGEDVVNVRDVANHLTVQTGGGPDTVTLSLKSGPQDVMVETGGNDDTVNVTLEAARKLTLTTGLENDRLNVFCVHAGATLGADLGDGDDIATVWEAEIDPAAVVTLDGGPGEDTLQTDTAGQWPLLAAPQSTDGHLRFESETLGSFSYQNFEKTLSFTAASVDAHGPYSIAEGDALVLTASAIPVAGTYVTTLQWDLNRDGLFEEAGDTVSAPVELILTVPWEDLVALGLAGGSALGTPYTIALRATDSGGNFVETEETVRLYDTPPDLRISGAARVMEGATYWLELTSSDQGEDLVTQWSICWDWVEGETNRFEPIPGNPSLVGHRYDVPGLKRIRARATDDDGTYDAVVTEGVFTLGVDVFDAVPILQINGGGSIDEGSLYELSVAALDPAGDENRWIIDWGDGSPVESMDVMPPMLTHIYADDGALAIRATAISDDGVYSVTKDVTVNNVAPELRIAGWPTADEGSSYTLFLAASDPGNDQIRSWTVDWGDGVEEMFDGRVRSVIHQYADDSAGESGGVYRITVSASDEDTTSQQLKVSLLERPLFTFDGGPEASGNFYTLTSGEMSWLAADAEAQALGGHLVEIGGYAEQDFLDRSFFGSPQPPGQLWIGLADLDGDGVLEWATGTEVDYARWREGDSGGQPHAATVRQADAGPATMAFEGLVAGSAAHLEAGLRLEAVAAGGSPGQLASASSVTGTAVAAHAVDDVFILADADRHPFRLVSVDVGSSSAAVLTFTGTLTDGGTVTQTFELIPGGSLQRLTFDGDFVDLVSVQWTPGSTLADNVAVARPLGLWTGMGGTEALQGIIELESIVGLDAEEAAGLDVCVLNVAPTVSLSGAETVDEGSAYRLTIGRPSDPGKDIVEKYVVHWGDGTATEVQVPSAPDGSPATLRVATHAYVDEGRYDITVEIVDEEGAHDPDPASGVQVIVENVPPMIWMPSYVVVDEGQLVTLAGTFSDPGSADTHEYLWHLVSASNGQAISDATTEEYSFTPTDNGIYKFEFTVTDDDGGVATDTLTVTVENAPPIVAELAVTPNGSGRSVRLIGSFTDAGLADTHTAVVHWGDGTLTETVNLIQFPGSGDLSAFHTYAADGTYTVTVTVTDDDGMDGTGDTMVILTTSEEPGARIVDRVLRIVGTSHDDKVLVGRQSHAIFVTADFLPGPLHTELFDERDVDRIEIIVGDGNDIVLLAGNLGQPALIHGGRGNDLLKGGKGSNIIVGGEGSDTILGHSGDDILIGGLGRDCLVGNSGDDILIGGTTAFDANNAALLMIMDEWTSHHSRPDRIKNLRGTDHDRFDDRLNADYYLVADGDTPTVFDDTDRDRLTGASGWDWFFANLIEGEKDGPKDKVNDLKWFEFFDELQMLSE